MADTDTQTSATEVARGYFGAIERGDRNAQREWYHPDAVLTLQGTFTEFGRSEVQLGAMPPQDSAAERGMAKAFNLRTRMVSRAMADAPLEVGDGVWRIRGGFPRKFFNVYAIRDTDGDGDADGVLFFDSGIAPMAGELRRHAMSLGGLTRIVLGHAHADHRGAAAALGVPVLCHPEEVPIALSDDGGTSLLDVSVFKASTRAVLPKMIHMWDGGPVEIESTLQEGTEIAGFRVVHLPGHSPGQIGLWRERDRLALTTDCFYRINVDTFLHSGPRLPPPGLAPGCADQVRASVRKVAALDPASAWPGHGEPVRETVRAQLEQLAAG